MGDEEGGHDTVIVIVQAPVVVNCKYPEGPDPLATCPCDADSDTSTWEAGAALVGGAVIGGAVVAVVGGAVIVVVVVAASD